MARIPLPTLLTLKLLSILAVVLASTLATAADFPKEVFVETDVVAAAKFSPWKTEALTAYAGTYAGDIGGDSSGNLVIKVAKRGKEDPTFSISGTYKLATAGQDTAVVTFTQGRMDDGEEKHATLVSGPVSITFVTYQGKPGVVIGGFFIPKS